MLSLFTDTELFAARFVTVRDQVTLACFPEQVRISRLRELTHGDEKAIVPLQHLAHILLNHLTRTLAYQDDGVGVGHEAYQPAAVGEVIKNDPGIIKALGNHETGSGKPTTINFVRLFKFQLLFYRVE